MRREALPQAAGMAGAPRPTGPAASSRSPMSRSTTAGNCSASSKRCPPKCKKCRRGASSPATSRPISASTARSIPIGAASMAASIASRGRRMPFSGCRPDSISRRSCSPRPMPRRRWSASLPSRATRSRTIAIGTNTDPYQPIERRYRIMRRILEVLSAANHPVGIVTKSALVLRDLDILKSMAERGLVKVALSVTTLDRKLARAMEPRASTPDKRLETVQRLVDAGVPASVMVAPIIPGLTDMEMERILERAAAAGVKSAGYVLLRLPLEIGDLFTEWLQANCPDRAKRVLSLMRSTRGGKLYDAKWGERMTGRRALCLDDRAAIRARRRAARAQQELGRAAHRPVHAAFPPRPATPAVLAVFPQAARRRRAEQVAKRAGFARKSPAMGLPAEKLPHPRAELRSRSGDDGPVSRPGCRHRRGGPWALGRAGRGRGGHSRSRPHPRRAQRFETDDAGGARRSLSTRSWPLRSSRWSSAR